MSERHRDVEAVILAGGCGSRLQDVVSDRPKPLAEVQGRPFLALLLDQIAAAGIRRVVFSTGFMADSIRSAFADRYRGLSLTHAREPIPLGTGGGLRHAAWFTSAATLVVLNGDSFCDVDVADFLDDHDSHGGVASMVLAKQDDTSRFGRVEVDGTRRILAFHEKNVCGGPGWINAGIYALRRTQIMALPADRPLSLEREVFPEWAKEGLRGYLCKGGFIDIGTPASYAAAELFFGERQRAALSMEVENDATG